MRASTNGAGLTGCIHVEEQNGSILITLHETKAQVDQEPQHKTGYTKCHRKESTKCLECIGTRDNFLHRTPMAQDLRPTIGK